MRGLNQATAETEEDLSIRKTIAHLMRIALAVSMPVSIAIFVSSSGCGKGLFPEVTGTSSTTPTPVGNAFLYTSNFTDGTVSAFTRNTNSGSLGFISKQSAGAVNGPVGIAVTSENDLVYVANAADGNIYPFSINQSGVLGGLTSLPKIASGLTPQMVTIDNSDSFVYVTNAGSRTVTEYVINSDGTLSSLGMSVTGFPGTPFAILANPAAPFVYVADSTVGLIYVFSVANNGLLTQVGTAINSNGNSPGNPGLMAMDNSEQFLFVDDMSIGVVSTFAIQSNGSLIYQNSVGTGQSTPIGIGAVNNGGGTSNNWVFTANKTGNFVQPFLRNSNILTQQASFTVSSAPTGLTIDPAGLYAYTGNAGNGTIGLIGINNSQCVGQGNCLIKTFASESPSNVNAGTQFIATTH